MTVTSTANKITYTGSGTTGPFTYNFKIFEDSDLEVVKYTIADGTSVVMTLTTDYTVTGAGNDAGGTVSLVAVLSSSYKLIIRRVLPITQEVDYIANDPFPAATHEEALDRSTMINQQQQEQLDRAVLVPIGTTTDPEDLLSQIEASADTATAAAATATAAVGSLVYYWGGTVGGTADAITLTPSPAITLYSAGMRFAFLATGTNTGATTVNISALGVKSVKTLLGAALAAGDITSGNIYSMTYDGTDFRLHESPKLLKAANGGTAADLSAALVGALPYFASTGVMAALAAGANNRFLKSTGASAPIFDKTYAFATSTRTMSDASGNTTVTGAGFTPRGAWVIASIDSTTALSIGYSDGTNHYCIYDASFAGTGANNWGVATSVGIGLYTTSAVTNQTGIFSSFNSDGGVITWTKIGSPTGTARLIIIFF